MNKGKLRQGVGGVGCAGEVSSPAVPGVAFWRAAPCFLCANNAMSWGSRDRRRKDAQTRLTAFTAALLWEMKNTLFQKALA